MLRIAPIVVSILMVAYPGLRASQRADSPEPRRQTVWDGLFTEEQAARGRDAYDKTCAQCHMADLSGHEYAGALAGYPFQLKWEDASVAELFGRIRTMPIGEPGLLTTSEYVDILAYVLKANGYPSGTDELSAAIAGQRWPRIKIERAK